MLKLSHQEELAVLSLAALCFGVIWHRRARALLARPPPKEINEPLLAVDEDGGEKKLIKSRVPLALRQLSYYAMMWFYGISAVVFLVRILKGHGTSSENYDRITRCVSHAARAVAWFAATRADACEYKSSATTRHTSFIIFFVVGSSACAVREGVPLHGLRAPSAWAIGAHFLYLLIAILTASTDHLVLRIGRDPTPEEQAVELHEIVGFTWLGQVFEAKSKQGKNEKLSESNLPALLANDRVGTTFPKLEKLVKEMKVRVEATGANKTLALFKTLATVSKGHFVGAGVLRIFFIFSGYLQPLALYIILKQFGKDCALGWAAVGMLFFGPILNSSLDNMQMFLQRRVATKCRGALMVLLYQKGAHLDMSAGSGRVGEVVSLMSADVQNVLNSLAYAHWVWAPVVQLTITLSALFWLVGIAAFGALAVMFLNSVANGQIFKRLTKYNKEFLQARSKRMELITEVLQGARIVKMLSFETGLAASVGERRNNELGILRKLLNCSVGIFTLLNSTPPLMGLATFMLLAAVLDRRFDAAEGFTALTLLDNLRFVLLQAPASINYIITGWASLERIQDFLDAPEVDEPPRSDTFARGTVKLRNADFRWGAPTNKTVQAGDDSAAIDNPLIIPPNEGDESKDELLEGGKLSADEGSPSNGVGAVTLTLSDVTVEVSPGKLCLVCGITGGGKSSLLSAMLGEIRKVRGTVQVCGSTAYSPQAAWCQNASIRENICFGSTYDEERFERCIEACALTADLESLPAGDATEVGERGVTLSGGQQQRVALARAIYHNADVYILDDPLSAVDAHVGEHLFQRVVKDTLLKAGKTVILATHQISVALQSADLVVVMTAEGTVAAQGTLSEIQKTQRGKELFAELVQGEKGSSRKKKKKGAATHEDKKKATVEKTSAPESGRLVREEERKSGAPAFKLFTLYVASAGPFFILGSTLFIVQQPIKYVQASSLTAWITRMEDGAPSGASTAAWIYVGWTAVFVLISLIAIIMQNQGALRASRILHERLAWRVLRCPISWYDRSPVGRIQNRFSTDIQSIDRQVSSAVTFCIRGAISPIVSLYAIGVGVWWLLPCFIPMLLTAMRIAKKYLSVARDLKRIDSTTKSPVYATFNESLTGLSTLRAFEGAVERFTAKFSALVDRTNSAELHLFACNFWLSVRLNTLGAFVTGLTAAVLYSNAAAGNGLSPPKAGLVLSYAVSFTSAMIMLLRTYADLEISLNAVERVHEYLDLPTEDDLCKPGDVPRWLIDTPGEVRYEQVTLRYPSQPEPALKSLSLVVESGESLGICGRTGAGKSTAMQSLLRLYPIEGGRVVIDGVDIATVGLRTLRGRIAIVPQEPTLFAGTVRHNLDMFGERSDDELNEAMASSRGAGSMSKSASHNSLGGSHHSLSSLAETEPESVTDLGLDYELHEFGTNLSVGERQLVCLARAIARKSRLVLMDEATANVDQRTDRQVQEILRSGSLSNATRITIAHRLNTIVYCDRVCVLSHGKLEELAPPADLLSDKKSMFYAMCDTQGNVQSLKSTALNYATRSK